ncbi:transposase [Halomonas alkalisoli]|uniref:transposase n=1 Tax=Halomonas alkalisoli TaxID=2907158 RepID=UPI0034E1BEC9
MVSVDVDIPADLPCRDADLSLSRRGLTKARWMSTSVKKTRTRHSQAYKDEALALADRVGASTAARELGLQPSQLYQWRAKANSSKVPRLAAASIARRCTSRC